MIVNNTDQQDLFDLDNCTISILFSMISEMLSVLPIKTEFSFISTINF